MAAAHRASLDSLRGAHLKAIKDAAPATNEEVQGLATQLMAHMQKIEVDPSKRGWYRLFRIMDVNDDGHIEYEEFLYLIRSHMRLSVKDLPEDSIKRVWNAIDLDGNGWMDAGEFGRFFRQGRKPSHETHRYGMYGGDLPLKVRPLTPKDPGEMAAIQERTQRLAMEANALQEALSHGSLSTNLMEIHRPGPRRKRGTALPALA